MAPGPHQDSDSSSSQAVSVLSTFVTGVDAYGPTCIAPDTAPDATRDDAFDARPPARNASNSQPGREVLSICVLEEYGLLSVLGPDARPFLNAQTTNDVLKLGDDGVQLDGYCTPKGRLLASFIEWPSPDGIYLAIARELAPPIAKRLATYVFRSKLKVLDESSIWMALGLQGSAVAGALARLGMSVPAPWQYVRHENRTALALPNIANGHARPEPRVMLWIARTEFEQVYRLLKGTWVSTQSWRAAEIEAGLPRIVAASAELFVPQMLNFDLINAVNFKKGCYPGQEIVARSQYLGKLKRRMLKGSTGTLPAPGDDVHVPGASPGSLEPVGKVVMAAARPGGSQPFVMLMELQLGHADSSELTVRGAAVTLEALPYAFPVEDPSARPAQRMV
jgi:tRNA-modifying protein YgfZ